MSRANDAIEVGGVRLTSPDRVLFPEQGITKRELAEYYLAVAPHMLPHVAGRPITLMRCPTGRGKLCFYQRHPGSGVPGELVEVPIEGYGDGQPFLAISDARGLVALVQMGVLEVHPWNSRSDRPDRPDRIIFDLDPGEGLGFSDVVAGASEVRERLAKLGLVSFAKTTGGKGLHVVVPIERRCDFDRVKAFARGFAEDMAAASPGRYLTRMAKAERVGRIFIDYLRNDMTATAVAPFSTRARQGAPVSTPVAWEELTPDLDPGGFDVRTVPDRLAAQNADPWADMDTLRQRLPSWPVSGSGTGGRRRGRRSKAAAQGAVSPG
jgi:bifunctional non-homologous end joining protein LigD